VEVAAAAVSEVSREILLTGSIRPQQEATIAATLSDRVVAVSVREGDVVKAGQILIRLDSARTRSRLEQAQAGLTAAQKQLALLKAGARSEQRAMAKSALEAAKSSLEKARLDLERMERLYAEGAAAEQQLESARNYYEVMKAQYESAQEQYNLLEAGARPEEIEAVEAAVEQAKAALNYARNDLEDTVLRSPISGVVHYRQVDVGDMPAPGVPLMRIAALEKVYFEATVPEKGLAELSVGQPVNISVDALPGESFPGGLERLVPVARADSRDFLARIAVENAEMRLKPGMFARGRVLVESHPEAVVVPRDALLEKDGEKVVFVVKGGRAEERKVVPGLDSNGLTEIVSGVSAGEEVVIAGQHGLTSGQPVMAARRQSDK
jgi:HlyD family secretion protein